MSIAFGRDSKGRFAEGHIFIPDDSWKEKQSLAHKDPKCGSCRTQFKKGQVSLMKGKHHSEESKEKERQKSLGKHYSPSTEFKKGQIPYNKGLPPEEQLGWRGGTSKEPYPFDFDEELKELIRKRDDYQCQLCGMPECEGDRKLDVHHIDFDKRNLSPGNLVALCRACNCRANSRKRSWQKYFGKRKSE